MSETTVSIQIRIRGFDAVRNAYPVEAKVEPGGLFKGELQLDREKLLIEEIDPKAYGNTLSDALFIGDIRDAYKIATGLAAGSSNGQLRVRLWIDNDAAELHHEISWERLFNESAGRPAPLATSADTPFSRYISLPEADPQPVSDRPLRVLVVTSNPKNLPAGLFEVNVEQELLGLSQALGMLSRRGQVAVSVMPGQSELSAGARRQLEEAGFEICAGVSSLSNILRCLQNKHVLHFVGHGQFRSDKGQGGRTVLHLEKDGGDWQAVDDETIVIQMGNLRPQPLLVFLAACESARGTGQGPFEGLGPKLVQVGVPAVVAMRDQVEMGMARDLTKDFYSRLLDHGEVDRALNEARNLLLSSRSVDWSIPVLYMRLRDGRLLKKPAGTGPAKRDEAKTEPVVPEPPEPEAEQRDYNAGPLDGASRSRLRKNLITTFGLSDLQDICGALDVDYESLPAGKGGLARELVLYCERRGMVPKLIEICRAERPGVNWYAEEKTSRLT